GGAARPGEAPRADAGIPGAPGVAGETGEPGRRKRRRRRRGGRGGAGAAGESGAAAAASGAPTPSAGTESPGRGRWLLIGAALAAAAAVAWVVLA
ncbi:MAG: hypothetical protein O9284_17750, partial [Steroidobacteraceae bacterium]|nr:hypothetical protein [Steroidobacteraceae bacterium]